MHTQGPRSRTPTRHAAYAATRSVSTAPNDGAAATYPGTATRTTWRATVTRSSGRNRRDLGLTARFGRAVVGTVEKLWTI